MERETSQLAVSHLTKENIRIQRGEVMWGRQMGRGWQMGIWGSELLPSTQSSIPHAHLPHQAACVLVLLRWVQPYILQGTFTLFHVPCLLTSQT